MQFTLKDGKVYVGWIVWLPLDPRAHDAYVTLLPYASGYRDPTTKTMKLSTRYSPIYERDDTNLDDFIKLMPVANIEFASIYREEVFQEFNKRRRKRSVNVVAEGRVQRPPRSEPPVDDRNR